ncbi:hypothetical protein [Vibrio sp. WXL210]|uniref:hypothetical protein n=1 Tax=Vibrio sp. WXL210 TaxID=3450709 RepID=UPI003EC72F4A
MTRKNKILNIKVYLYSIAVSLSLIAFPSFATDQAAKSEFVFAAKLSSNAAAFTQRSSIDPKQCREESNECKSWCTDSKIDYLNCLRECEDEAGDCDLD